jgi:hypothetical protein
MARVEVRPIEVIKWHGKMGKESFARAKKVRALVDTEKMQYATGLTQDDIKELKKKGVNYDLSSSFDPDSPHPFWDSNLAAIKLENHTMFFETDNPLDFIKLKVMKASKYVANSMSELEEGLYPEATHVLFDEAEQAEVLASKIEIEENAILEAHKLSPTKKQQIILILGDKNVKNQSPNFVTVELNKVIKKDPAEFLRYTKLDAAQLANHALVLEALQANILRREGNRIYHMDAPLGLDVVDVVEYISKEENQDIKLLLMSKLNT